MRLRPTVSRVIAPLTLALAAGASADVFPTTAASSGGNTIPCGLNTVYHEVFASTLFSNVTGGQPALITRISGAPLNNIRYRAGVTVRLGYTAAAPGTLAAPPSNTGGGGAPNATVPPGMTDFFVAPSFLGTFSGSSDSNFQMALEGAPFVYDPTQGNLLLEVVIASPGLLAPAMSATNAPAEASRAYNNGVMGTSTAGALRWDFTFSTHAAASTGACCFADGTCSSATLAGCQGLGGAFKGDGVSCASSPCPQPGACCKSDGTCASLLNSACIAGGGAWQGTGSACGSVTCAQPGGCCAADGTCANTLQADCIALGSVWKQATCSGTCTPHVLIAPHATCTFPVICNSSAAATATNVGLYLDLTAAASSNLAVTRLDFNSNATAGTAITATVWIKDGTYVGFDGNQAAWTQFATFNVQSNGTSQANPPVHLDLPSPLFIQQGRTLGVCIVANTGGLRYRTNDPAVSNADLALSSAVNRTPAFTGAAVTRGLSGAVAYDLVPATAIGACCSPGGSCSFITLGDCLASGGIFRGEGVACGAVSCPQPPCYPNCDGSTTSPVLNVADFTCFLQKYAAGDTYANCDASTSQPVLNVADFTCFLQKYAAGCT